MIFVCKLKWPSAISHMNRLSYLNLLFYYREFQDKNGVRGKCAGGNQMPLLTDVRIEQASIVSVNLCIYKAANCKGQSKEFEVVRFNI